MGNIKFSGPGMSDQNVTDDTKTLVENHAVTDDFKYSSGLKWDAYLKAKILTLLGASKKILRANAANDALEGKTLEELIKEILTTNERLLYRSVTGSLIQIPLPITEFPEFYIGGFELTGTVAQIQTGKGSCKTVDATPSFDLNLTTTFTKTFSTWTSGSGNGGIFGTPSLVPNNVYYIFLIWLPLTQSLDMGFSVSKTLPFGYTDNRIIGSFATDKNGNIALSTLFNHETYYEHGVNGIPYEPNFTTEIKLEKIDFQTIEIKEMYCRDLTNSLNIKIFQDFQITTNTTGSGGNLLDPTLLADTQYYIYLVTKNNGIDTTAYISSSLTPPFSPNDFIRLIGAFKTDASFNIRKITLTPDKKADGNFINTRISVQEKWLANTNGGVATINAWTKRNFNFIEENTIPTAIVDCVTNIISLPVGIYDIYAEQALSQCWLLGRLYDITASATLLNFTNCENNHQSGDIITCNGRFEITQQTDLEIHYYAKTTLGNQDLGCPGNVTGHLEQYLNAIFTKVK